MLPSCKSVIVPFSNGIEVGPSASPVVLMNITLEQSPCRSYWTGRFSAMASPCEVLMEVEERTEAQHILQRVAEETWRIEKKFSRYRQDNLIYRINHSGGEPLELDDETALLLNYADQCFQLSDGLFDITAGVLRRIWSFQPGAIPPSESQVRECLSHIGWSKVRWNPPLLHMPQGMEIDLGGIGKEYAVDKVAQWVNQATEASFVINFGGDLFVSQPRRNGQPWQVAVDDPAATGVRQIGQISVAHGGIATSGDARRFLLHEGKRYSHILNPRTGYPIENAPRSVTVIANTCLEAGMLATFAVLQGPDAKQFLEAQQVPFWIVE